MSNFIFLVSLTSFIVFFVAGILFFIWWLKSKRQYQFLLYFAIGLGSLLWFKIPNILVNAHVNIVQQNFYPFFFVTILMYFAAYFAILKGLSFFTKSIYKKFTLYFLKIWFGSAVLYFGLTFFIPGFDLTYAPVWASHLLFFIPVQLYILHKLWRIAKQPMKPLAIQRFSIILTSGGILLLLVSSILYIIVQVRPYPLEFWYFAVTSSVSISFFQIASGLMLFTGLYLLSKYEISQSKNFVN